MKKMFTVGFTKKQKKKMATVLAFVFLMLALSGFLVIDPKRASEEGYYWIEPKAPAVSAEAPAGAAPQASNVSSAPSTPAGTASASSMPSKLRRLGSEPEINYLTAYVNDVACVRLPIFDGKIYAAIWQFASILGESMNGEYIGDTGFKVSEYGTYIEIGDRAVVPSSDVIKTPTKIYYPLDMLCGFYGLGYEASADMKRADFKLEEGVTYRVKTSAEVYVDSDLYWLSRLIEAEAGKEPLEGKIAVGNVVLNRVKTPGFPDDVLGVIFDKEHGVQFGPAESGNINVSPSEESIIAAKLCFEGVDMSGGSLYFVNPKVGADNWFKSELTFIKTIGRHDFYA